MSGLSARTEKDLAEFVARFRYDPYGFVLAVWPWGRQGTALHHRKGPEDWQRDFLISLGEHCVENQIRKSIGLDYKCWRSAVASGHGVGKALSLTIDIDTPAGVRRWGDLTPGDVVFGGDGKPTRIIATTPHVAPMYRVTFDDRTYLDVSSGHLWNVRGRQERRNNLPGWRTLETIEIVNAGVKRSNGSAQARQWEIPVQGAAEFEEREIGLHPYLVGLWLSGGKKGHPSVTKPFMEVIEKVGSLGYETSIQHKGFRVLGVAPLFQEGVFALGSHERFIPDEYKYNTVANRMALLGGLCDGDGEAHHTGSIGYSTTSLRLAEDVAWLARSLGCKAMLQPTTKKGGYVDEDGERVECRDCYRVTINAPFNPFTILHRKVVYKPSEARYLSRWIDSIEPIGEAPCMCITVENDDGLYLASDFIVTHNSALVAWLIWWLMSTRPDCRGVVTANTGDQLEKKTWPEVAKWKDMAINKHWFTWTASTLYFSQYPEDKQKNYMVAAQTVSPERTEAFAGLHNEGSAVFVIKDEASAIDPKIWEVADGAFTDGEPFDINFGNPTRPDGSFFDCFGKNASIMTYLAHVDSRSVSHTNKSVLEDIIRKYGIDSDEVKVRVLGDFPSQAFDGFLNSETVREAMSREVWADNGAALVLGVDVARFGDDSTVFFARRGRDARSIKRWTFKGLSTVEVAHRVVDFARLYKPDEIVIESIGPGAGVIDTLRSLNYKVTEVHPGEKAEKSSIYFNRRVELWANMRDWLATGGGCLPEDPDLFNQLVNVRYTLDGNGEQKMLLEPKKAMKTRGLPSPDDADALALTFHARAAKRNSNGRIFRTDGAPVARMDYDEHAY